MDELLPRPLSDQHPLLPVPEVPAAWVALPRRPQVVCRLREAFKAKPPVDGHPQVHLVRVRRQEKDRREHVTKVASKVRPPPVDVADPVEQPGLPEAHPFLVTEVPPCLNKD